MQTEYLPQTLPVTDCCACCLPSAKWEADIVASFLALRQVPAHCLFVILHVYVGVFNELLMVVIPFDVYVGACTCEQSLDAVCRPDAPTPPPAPPVALPPVSDTKRWRQFCFGSGVEAGSTGTLAPLDTVRGDAPPPVESVVGPVGPDASDCDSDGAIDDTGVVHVDASATATNELPPQPRAQYPHGVPPWLSVLAALDHVNSVILLDRHVRRVCSAVHVLSRSYCLWMYGLLARLDLPMAPDTASALRSLLKHCCRLRASSVVHTQSRPVKKPRAEEGNNGHTDGGGPSPPVHSCDDPPRSDLVYLNILITLLHQVFGQMER